MTEPFMWSQSVQVTDLTGQLLVANPHLDDPHFNRTVVYVLEHTEDGALGVVLNRPSEVDVSVVLPEWGNPAHEQVLYHGGPVGTNCALGVAIVSGNSCPLGWQPISGSIGLIDLDTADELAQAQLSGVRIFAGYAGWQAGQLEEELAQEAWFIVDAYPGDFLTEQADQLWRSVLRRQPNDLVYLSTYVDDPTLN